MSKRGRVAIIVYRTERRLFSPRRRRHAEAGIRFYGSLAVALLVWGGLSRRMNSEPRRAGGHTASGGFDRPDRPGEIGPYGSVEKHREVLLGSGADPQDVDDLMRQLYGSRGWSRNDRALAR